MARSKKHHEEAEGEGPGMERWLLTYSDMITLLMVLFIVLFALGQTDVRKFNAFKNSFRAIQNNSATTPPGGPGVLSQPSAIAVSEQNPFAKLNIAAASALAGARAGAKASGQQPSGDSAAGHKSQGQKSSGQQPRGQSQAGQQPSGQSRAGSQAVGDSHAGPQASGQSQSGRAPEGQSQPGQQAKGQSLSGQQLKGQSQAGQQPMGQASTGQETLTSAPPGGGTATEERIALAKAEGEMERALARAGLADEVTFSSNVRGLVVTILTDKVLFPLDSAKLQPEGIAIIDALAPVLTALPNQIDVEGDTDDQPIHGGPYANNWALSAARAVAVVTDLIADHGMDPARLQATGNSDTRPVVPNDSARHQAENRRVEIVVFSTSVVTP
jgi:flagellar motor protein MotB